LPTERLGIAGTGLIGASIGLRARSLGYHVTGADAQLERAERARARGALDAVSPDPAALAASADILVVAMPLDATCAFLADFPRVQGRPRLILDVASLKAPVVRAAAGIPGFVATHPIAGSEASGPDAALADLFSGRIWAIVPGEDGVAVAAARSFVERLGSRVLLVDAVDHDRILAFTSHVPQLLSVALAAELSARLDDPTVRPLCGSGIRSMTRLGGSSWAMWEPLLAAAAPQVAQEVRRLIAVLSDVATALDAGDLPPIAERFAAAAAAVADLRANDGPPPAVL
jgi:prephenate dehydrogenase